MGQAFLAGFYCRDPIVWATRVALVIFVFLAIFSPDPSHSQSVDPTTTVTSIYTWLTGPFSRIVIALILGVVGVACAIGHHPFAAVGSVLLGCFFLFGGQFFANMAGGGGG
jgi:type IV secretory pathway VirB2 component (pilin)